MDIKTLTIQTALVGLRSKKFTSVALVESCLNNIEKHNKEYNVFLTVEDKNKLLEAARHKDATDHSLPLSGIPIALKDLFSTTDLRTTAGSKVLENYTAPKYDSTVVRKLKEAGAIIIGKVNEDAWGHGSSGENSDFGPTKNPYDKTRVPGGSSSGSAVAIRLGMCLAATGSDTGSSVRLPAAFCNLVGLKPTYGRVSRYGVISMASSFDTIGHITKTILDNALISEITAGKDPYDGTTVPVEVPKYTNLDTKSKKITVGLPREFFNVSGVDPKVSEVTQDAIKTMADLGFEFTEISLPHTEYAMSCYYILVPSEISSNLARYDGVRFGNSREKFGPEAKRRIMIGAYALSSGYYDAYYKTAAKVRTLIKKDYEDAFKKVDLILAPVSPTSPFKIGEKENDPVAMYLSDIFLCPINIAGVPSLSVPCGFTGNLPVGIQFIGPQFSEDKIYQAAKTYEDTTGWYKTEPKL